jgi:hypothetical protein
MANKDAFIQLSTKIHSANYIFTIMDRGASVEGYTLHVCSPDKHVQDQIPGLFFDNLDLDHITQVRDAVIESEKNSEFFIVRSGKDVLHDMSRKILSLKKPKKEKVFSMRFDRELKARFAEKCERSGRSQSEAMRILMEYYLSHGIPALREV